MRGFFLLLTQKKNLILYADFQIVMILIINTLIENYKLYIINRKIWAFLIYSVKIKKKHLTKG
jgi:hypothetical protein